MKVGTDAMVLGASLPHAIVGKALDIGTGTGVLALMIAQNNPNLEIIGVELDRLAANEAKENVSNSNFSSQIEVLQGDYLTYESKFKYDLIVSNPPYFEDSFKSGIKTKNQARHNDSMPLKEFMHKSEGLLNDTGSLWLVYPALRERSLLEEAKKVGLILVRKIDVFGKSNHLVRVVVELSRTPRELDFKELTIRNEAGKYTKDYIALTKEFYAIGCQD